MSRTISRSLTDVPEGYWNLKRAGSDDIHIATRGDCTNGQWTDGALSGPPTPQSFRQRRSTLTSNKHILEDIREVVEEDNSTCYVGLNDYAQRPIFGDPFSGQPPGTTSSVVINTDQELSIGPLDFRSDKRPRRDTENGQDVMAVKRRKIEQKDIELEGRIHALLRRNRNTIKQPPRPRSQLSPEELAELASYGKIPIEALVQGTLLRGTSTVNIDIDLDALHLAQDQERSLYVDTLGYEPPGQSPMDDVDVYNVPLNQKQWQEEMERAMRLSKKSILNAPPANTMLPFDEMHDITLEEFIVYFPNHVLRWPGLALGLRHTGWDRLFHRVARMINIARGSHGFDREHKHAEPAVCMLKVQVAIQEIEHNYNLNDHDSVWAHQLSLELVLAYINKLPKGFSANTARNVSLAEAGEYVGRHEFESRPFSQRVSTAVIAKQAACGMFETTENPILRGQKQLSGSEASATRIFGRIFSASSQGSWDSSGPQNSGYQAQGAQDHVMADSDAENPAHPARGRSDAVNNTWNPAQFGSNPRFQSWSAQTRTPASSTPPDTERQSGARQRQQPQSANSDPTQGWPDSNGATPRRQRGLCSYDQQCDRADCRYAHHSPEGDPSVELNTDQPCRDGVLCCERNCPRTHPSPASFDARENYGGLPESNRQGQGNNILRGDGQRRNGRRDQNNGDGGNGSNFQREGGPQSNRTDRTNRERSGQVINGQNNNAQGRNNGNGDSNGNDEGYHNNRDGRNNQGRNNTNGNGQGRGRHRSDRNGRNNQGGGTQSSNRHNGNAQGRNDTNGNSQGREGRQTDNNSRGSNNQNEGGRGTGRTRDSGGPQGSQRRNGGGRGGGGARDGRGGGGNNSQTPRIFGTGAPQGNNRGQMGDQRPSTPRGRVTYRDEEL